MNEKIEYKYIGNRLYAYGINDIEPGRLTGFQWQYEKDSISFYCSNPTTMIHIMDRLKSINIHHDYPEGFFD